MTSILLSSVLPSTPLLRPDETVEDWLAISASLYSSDYQSTLTVLARALNWALNEDGSPTDVDGLREVLRTELQPGSTWRGPHGSALALKVAQSYCPLCIREDLHRGKLPHFRADWRHCLRTICGVHQSPLFLWQLGGQLNPKGLPAWLAENYRRSCSLSRRAKKPEGVDAYGSRLRKCREVRKWREKAVEMFDVLTQQAIWEKALIDPASHHLIEVIVGSDRDAFRRTFDDLAVVYLALFSADWRESHPLSNYSYLGPRWLFAAPARMAMHEIDRVAPLSGEPDPAKRRSVIALVMRTIAGFHSDISCDPDGRITDAGGTTLSTDLRNLSNSAKDFLSTRSSRWSPVTRAGMRRALS